MIGYFSEGVAILGVTKLLTASFPYFYGSPVGYIALMILVGLTIALWVLLLKLTQSTDEYGGSQPNPVAKVFAPAAAILALGIPVAIQWQTFATPAQTAHLTCVVQTAGTRADRCFADWVKKTQEQRQKKVTVS